MNHPPYHLRTHKAIDRWLFVDLIEALCRAGTLKREHLLFLTLAGPLLEDCRLFLRTFPKATSCAIESDPETHKRQKFHLPSRRTKLVESDMLNFLNGKWLPQDRDEVVWLDFTSLSRRDLDCLRLAVQKVNSPAVVRISVQADVSRWKRTPDSVQKIARDFGDYVPQGFDQLALEDQDEFRRLVLKMCRIAIELGLEGRELSYHPLLITGYADGSPMLTVAGVVLDSDSDVPGIEGDFDFACSKDWDGPVVEIEVPHLSLKEQMTLEMFLPEQLADAGEALHACLNYSILSDPIKSKRALGRYARFVRYYPPFMRMTL